MKPWQTDKQWSDRFLPEIKAILGHYLLINAPAEEDAERNTDLIVLGMRPARIACRVRRYEHLGEYGHQFTFRMSRPSGAKSELAKIIEGWGDYFFYGFCDSDERSLVLWHLGNLSAFRGWFMRALVKLPAGVTPGITIPNRDGSSHFKAFSWDDVGPDFVVASNVPDAPISAVI